MKQEPQAPPATPIESRLHFYQQSVERLAVEELDWSRQWRLLGLLRGGIFLLSLGSLAGWIAGQFGWGTTWLWLALFWFIAFIAIAGIHETLAAKIYLIRMRLRMNRDAVLRQQRKLRQLESIPQIEVPEGFRGVARDLDLFGDNSLYRLLATVRTPAGLLLLRDYLLEGASDTEIHSRQDAVRELRDQVDWRGDFQLICEQLSVSEAGPGKFVDWCESESWVHRWWPILWIARVCLIVWLLIPFAWAAGWLAPTIAGVILLVTAAVSFLLSVLFAGSIHDIFNRISARQEDVRCYNRLFNQLAGYSPQSERLLEIHTRLFERGDLRSKLSKLGLLTWLANFRRNGIFFLAYLVLQLLFFWDIHVLDLLERWKRKNAAGARSWFADLAQWEVLVSMAQLAWDHPDWQFPTVMQRKSPSELRLVARQIGHPLLAQNESVRNDVELGPPGTLLLVTGSNMSGKSTLLRSIGLNAVLAQMGAPVCAQSLQMIPLTLATSMRISDSLADGVSFFMAELKRLKEIVQQADELGEIGERGMLFLLDEILQGTNSRERQIAVSRVLNRLLAAGAIGAVSTHDLELAALPELKSACRPVYFAESFSTVEGRKTMTFDYKMHQGVSPTTNALKLLELVGL